MKNYDSVFDAVDDLIERGYTIDFTTEPDKNCPPSDRTLIRLPSDDFQVDEIHRFESDTGLGDEMIVFAVSSTHHHVKGIVVNAYGMYADKITSVVEDISLYSD